MQMESLDPASANATELLQGMGIDIQPVSYKAGLVQPFSGSTTLTPPEVLGSPITLAEPTNASVYDAIESLDPANTRALTAVTTPNPSNAALTINATGPVSDNAAGALSGMAKFGTSLAMLMGLHPVQYSESSGTPSGTAPAVETGFIISGPKLIIAAIVGTALILLLLNQGE